MRSLSLMCSVTCQISLDKFLNFSFCIMRFKYSSVTFVKVILDMFKQCMNSLNVFQPSLFKLTLFLI